MATQTKDEKRRIQGTGCKSLFGSALAGVVLALLISIPLLLAATFVFSAKPELTGQIRTVGSLVGALSALLGGFVAGKKQKHAGALAGMLFGVMFVGLLLFIGNICGGGALLIKRAIRYGIFLLLSVLGGALGGMQVKGHHRKRRRR